MKSRPEKINKSILFWSFAEKKRKFTADVSNTMKVKSNGWVITAADVVSSIIFVQQGKILLL